jgi:hypothetical protein
VLRPVERLPDGRVRVDAHLTRCGIFEYRNPDGSTRREYRPEEEVFNTRSMRSFALVPFTDDHPPDLLSADDAASFTRGSTGNTVVRDDDHIRTEIGVFDRATIQKMDAGKLHVSCGYTCDLEETPGFHPVWGHYDAIQRNIVGNHVALVDMGRAGSAAVRMDAAYTCIDEWDESLHPRAEDGKFGSGSGGANAAQARHAAYMKEIAAKAAGMKSGKSKAAKAKNAASGTKAAPAAKTKSAKAPAATKAPAVKPESAAEKLKREIGAVPTSATQPAAATSSIGAHQIVSAVTGKAGGSPHSIATGDTARRAAIAAPRTQASSNPYIKDKQFSSSTQKAIREHHDAVLAHYGLANEDARKGGGRVVQVSEGMKIGDAQTYGSHGQEAGDVMLWSKVADNLSEHAKLSPSDVAGLGKRALAGDKKALRMMDAYRVSTHEALHGHGPEVIGNSRNGTFLDEVTTELVARQVSADLHGIAAHDVPGSYDRMIRPTVSAIARASGKSEKEAYGALTKASLDFKRQRGGAEGSETVEKMMGDVLKSLGVNDTAKQSALYEEIDRIDSFEQEKWGEKYPSVNRYE